MVRQHVYSLSPSATWDYWEKAKEGLDRRVDQKYADKMAVYGIAQGFLVLLALIGAGLIVVGMASWKKRREMAKRE